MLNDVAAWRRCLKHYSRQFYNRGMQEKHYHRQPCLELTQRTFDHPVDVESALHRDMLRAIDCRHQIYEAIAASSVSDTPPLNQTWQGFPVRLSEAHLLPYVYSYCKGTQPCIGRYLPPALAIIADLSPRAPRHGYWKMLQSPPPGVEISHFPERACHTSASKTAGRGKPSRNLSAEGLIRLPYCTPDGTGWLADRTGLHESRDTATGLRSWVRCVFPSLKYTLSLFSPLLKASS
ncbi:hypothetical protein GE09DRAFT_235702 [Coniochaeta sp. 2T2.1]|nr:hypothetical protein GE09DRAFT_235702 [Coniochaeta sp. 2T2.1]